MRYIDRKRERYLEAVSAYLGKRYGTAKVEPAKGGVRSLVFRCEVPGEGAIAFKGNKLFEDMWLEARALKLLRGRGIRVPELLWADWNPVTRLRYRFWPMAQRWVEGQLVKSGDAEIGRALAELHSLESRWRGYPGLPRPGSFVSSLIRQSDEAAASLEQIGYGPARELSDWFRAHRPPHAGNYSLLHGRINRDNMLRAPDGIYWLDVGKVQFGTFAYELVRALWRLGGEEGALLDGYFSRRPEKREEFEASRLFYEAEFHLSLVNFCLRRLLRQKPGRFTTQRFERHLSLLTECLAR